MTNAERARQLIREAEAIWREVESLLERENLNLCIRRCQEVVELALKAMLIQMGKDYPKVHDVAPIVLAALREKSIHPESGFSEWLLTFSATLTSRRAPAFYFERSYSREEALESLDGTRKVLQFVRSFFRESA